VNAGVWDEESHGIDRLTHGKGGRMTTRQTERQYYFYMYHITHIYVYITYMRVYIPRDRHTALIGCSHTERNREAEFQRDRKTGTESVRDTQWARDRERASERAREREREKER
jgi:hypothetical protein